MQGRVTVIAGWVGSMSGLLGSALLSFNTEWSVLGWWAFLISNFAWIWFALSTGTRSLLIMQAGFMMTTVNGLTNWA